MKLIVVISTYVDYNTNVNNLQSGGSMKEFLLNLNRLSGFH